MRLATSLILFMLALNTNSQTQLSFGVKPQWFDEPQAMNDRAPTLKEPLELHYPAGMKKLRREGTCIVAVAVSARGIVLYAEVLHSSGYGAFDSLAIEAVADADFKPALRHGKPVSTRITLPVQFKLNEEDSDEGKTVEELEREKREMEERKRVLQEEQRKLEEEIRKLKEKKEKAQ